MDDKQQVHRPGAFKQVNKGHKHGRHRSKGSISLASKGKVSVKAISKKKKDELNRLQRRHQLEQLRKKKTDEILMKKRKLGGLSSPPFLVCVLPLQLSVSTATALSLLKKCDSEAVINTSKTGATHLTIPRFKQRYSFVIPALDNEFSILDTLKVCDTVLFLTSASDDQVIDEWGHSMLDLAFAQGLPSTVIGITDLETIHPKKQNDAKQNIQKYITKYFIDEKVCTIDNDTDAINVIRRIGNQKQKVVPFRNHRPFLYAEEVEFEPSTEADDVGTLKVTGYLRENDLSVNALVHIPGLGDFQMSQIDELPDPYSMNLKEKKTQEVDGKIAVTVLGRADPEKQESLVSENTPDPMDAEQTWPTQEELDMSKAEQQTKTFKVPTGCSEYQAMWHEMADDENEEGLGEEEEDDEMMMETEGSENESDGEDEILDNESEVPVNEDRYDKELDLDAEKADLEKIKAAKVDFQFPDEIDTPANQTARERFQKYRHLESFKTSPWDPLENLPPDYGRIFQISNYPVAKPMLLKKLEEMETTAKPGMYITVYLKNVPKERWQEFQAANAPVVLIGMFPMEHKMSVINARVKRTKNYQIPIRSRERLIFMCGYRRFSVEPIFSQHTNGSKFKFERFFQTDTVSVASFFAPIQFPPAPVTIFKEVRNQLVLVAKGEILATPATRVVLKRVVLTGYPFKVHKCSAVIRFMFFNPEDVNYFKVCELRTKEGRKGKIKEALGTHGHMKCHFNKPLKSHDTVMINLYKRVFPKWTYEEIYTTPADTMEQ